MATVVVVLVGGSGNDTSTTAPSIPCANLTGFPSNAYDDDSENSRTERQSVVAGTAVYVNDAVDPSETTSSTPTRLEV